MNILGFISAHKVASLVVGGVIIASGATGAVIIATNGNEPVSDTNASQIVNQDPNTTPSSSQSTVPTDTIDEQLPTAPVDDTGDRGEIVQSAPSPEEILAEKCAEIDANYNRILDDGELLMSEWLKFRDTLTAEERSGYPMQHGSYRGKLIRDKLAEREQAGCPTN